MLYIGDEAFFTGTAAEVTHLRSVDRILVGDGKPGPITRQLTTSSSPSSTDSSPDRYGWLTPVNVNVEQAVTV